MKLTPIEDSSAITGYSYDRDTKKLTIQFSRAKSPTVIEDVEPQTVRDFLEAKSKGQFFHQRLR